MATENEQANTDVRIDINGIHSNNDKTGDQLDIRKKVPRMICVIYTSRHYRLHLRHHSD